MEYSAETTPASNGEKGAEDDRKIFVGGLSWESTEKDLRTYFEKFGAVEKATLKTDPMTGESRGFGFILFEDSSSVEGVIAEESHTLNGKKIGPRRAKGKPQPEPILKVFVGGLDPTVPEETIRSHFESFGTIEEINLPMDREKNERRNFCFVKFESEDIVNTIIASNNAAGKQTIGEKEVDIKKHTPKDGRGRGRGRGGFGGRGRGDFGGGYGGYGGGYGYAYGGGYGGGYEAYGGAGGYDYTQDYFGSYDQGFGGGYGKAPRGRGRGRGGYAPY